MCSPYVGDDFAAHATLPGLVAGHYANRGREDGRAHPAHHARDLLVGDVATPARAGDPLQAGDHRRAPIRVLEPDPDRLAHPGRLDHVVVDVALLGEDPAHLLLETRRRHLDFRVLRGDRVADAGQVVGYRVGHHQRQPALITSSTWSSRGCTPGARAPAGTVG